MRAIPGGELSEKIAEYVVAKVGMSRPLVPGMYQTFAVVNDKNDLVAGVIISEYRGTDCEILCASETGVAWRPHVCKAIFTYVFKQLGCVRCTSITTKSNKKARDFLEALGFSLEGRLRLAYDGSKDALIYGLLAAECRYLADESEEKHVEEIRPSGTSGTRSSRDRKRARADEQRNGDCASQSKPN